MGSDLLILPDELAEVVSIHAPAWGATYHRKLYGQYTEVSIHAPTWGATSCSHSHLSCARVSIHAPTWGATHSYTAVFDDGVFQSTLPRGERPWRDDVAAAILSFNPRSHVGSDRPSLWKCCRIRVSIHAPTWGATGELHEVTDMADVSIHAPTWGATLRFFHSVCSFLFQSTLPRGERHDVTIMAVKEEVSIHAPTWGATHEYLKTLVGLRVSIHAPTWGATALSSPESTDFRSFNPRSHVGSDS